MQDYEDDARDSISRSASRYYSDVHRKQPVREAKGPFTPQTTQQMPEGPFTPLMPEGPFTPQMPEGPFTPQIPEGFTADELPFHLLTSG